MKRHKISLAQVADWDNLASAFYRAAKGAHPSRAVADFRANLNVELSRLQQDLLHGNIRVGQAQCFIIHDPKQREIHAPCFRERVLHHALMAHVGPILDRALVDDTYACRKGKGTLAAVQRCQQHMRRFGYFVQIDIRAYFAAIDHALLLHLLSRKLKGAEVLALIWRILDANHTEEGKGLPIGALTSQHFANYYLQGLDRWLLENPAVRGMVRYMDDIIWFCDDRTSALQVLQQVDDYLATLQLMRKANYQAGCCSGGTVFCGFRILPSAIRLTRRKRRRYSQRRRYWENAYLRGAISERKLQTAYDALLGVTLHSDATAWRREQLRRVPLSPELL